MCLKKIGLHAPELLTILVTYLGDLWPSFGSLSVDFDNSQQLEISSKLSGIDKACSDTDMHELEPRKSKQCKVANSKAYPNQAHLPYILGMRRVEKPVMYHMCVTVGPLSFLSKRENLCMSPASCLTPSHSTILINVVKTSGGASPIFLHSLPGEYLLAPSISYVIWVLVI